MSKYYVPWILLAIKARGQPWVLLRSVTTKAVGSSLLPEPMALMMGMFKMCIRDRVTAVFDLRPAAIIRDLDLRRPIYRQLAAYGHMGREDLGVNWEKTDRVQALKAAVASLTQK